MVTEIPVKTNERVELLDITSQVEAVVGKSGIKRGTCLVFVPHTTAAVTINENADPDVKTDMKEALTKILPGDINYRHMEGNSEAHILSSLIGVSLSLIIENGKLLLGTWQGIFFCEFDGPRKRRVFVKITE